MGVASGRKTAKNTGSRKGEDAGQKRDGFSYARRSLVGIGQ